MSPPLDGSLWAIFLPAVGALFILALDLRSRGRRATASVHRADALAGIRTGSIAAAFLAAVWIALRMTNGGVAPGDALFRIDLLAIFGLVLITSCGFLVLGLALTHFGMARSRPAEPIALLLFSLSGMAAAIAANHLLVVMIALELAWLPIIALIAIDSRRLSSSESSLKAFFAHVLASLILAHGVAFLFGATGRFDFLALSEGARTDSMFWEIGTTLVLVGVIARSAIAPFHPWSPDVHEGAPSFVTAHLATAAQVTSFIVLLRIVYALPDPGISGGGAELLERVPGLFAALGCLGLVWGHAMALVQVGLRRLLGWLGVGQASFFALALATARGSGGEALLLGLIATSLATIGVLAILSSLSHHERACEHVGDLSGMMKRSPIRAALFALFLLSLVGFPGTIGFVARLEILSSVEHAGQRGLLVAGLGATVLGLMAIGRPLLAMLRPFEATREPSRALTNEQLVLAVCGAAIVYFGFAPAIGDGSPASLLAEAITSAVRQVGP